ncbi:hypothetical protein HYH02_002571 [Chlamydomonas schloesseri]|uniref:Uncharacterized protein n=1 Tax=Chlamydomonas schloesseri TaxID=2026947 RepID=A0A836BBD9_9CHLO|nr:hypothetical protein HYH02_002571 [Chlamydomonas schloesseri]|eukprot:KAG2453248.1 hypothetical protein HYH02_002571 [Chlamydomonas schloesseri]
MANLPAESGNWAKLTPDVIRNIAQRLHPNDVATGLSLVNSDTADVLRQSYHTLHIASQHQHPLLRKIPRAVQPWPGRAFLEHWGRPEPWRALGLSQRRRLLCLAASSGHAPSLDAALEHCGCAVHAAAVQAAGAAGQSAAFHTLLHRLRAEHTEWEPGPVAAALRAVAVSGTVDDVHSGLGYACHNTLDDEKEYGDEYGDHASRRHCCGALVGACAGGREDVLQWMEQEWDREWIERSRRQRIRMAVAAAVGGHAQLLEQLIPRLPKRARPEVLVKIAAGCPLDVFVRYFQAWHPERGAPDAALGRGGGDAEDEDYEDYEDYDKDEVSAVADCFQTAVRSSTPCWRAKADWLLGRWRRLRAAAGAHGSEGASPAPPEDVSRLDLTDEENAYRADAWMKQPRGSEAFSLERMLYLDSQQLLWCKCARGTEGRHHTHRLDGCVPHCARAFMAAAAARAGAGAEVMAWLLDACGLTAANVAQVKSDTGIACLRIIRENAVRGGRLEVLQELRRRGLGFGPNMVQSAIAKAPEAWKAAVRAAASRDCGWALLRRLRERGEAVLGLDLGLGLGLDLGVLAAGGNVDAMEWALGELRKAGAAPRAISVEDLRKVCRQGDRATLDWLEQQRLAPPLPILDALCKSIECGIEVKAEWGAELLKRLVTPEAEVDEVAMAEEKSGMWTQLDNVPDLRYPHTTWVWLKRRGLGGWR